jgi:hypothetical protein
VSFSERWRRPLAGGMAAVAAVPLGLVLLHAKSWPGSQVALAGGQAWLASPTQGVVTLIDGASEQVVGLLRVPGAEPGRDLIAVQAGSSAYVVQPATGGVSRLDGRTYEVSRPVQFGEPGAPLSVYPGVDRTYVIDGQRRLASLVDPVTLTVKEQRSMPGRPAPGQSVVDSAGRLWAVDRTGLVWFDSAGQHVRVIDGGDTARLVLVGGRAVLVDPGQRRAGTLRPDGTVESWSCLDLRPGEPAQLLGSTALGRVVAAVPSSGLLVGEGQGGDGCGQVVAVGRPDDDFGPLVETAGLVFVPNRTTGHTTVVDFAAGKVVADLAVAKPGARVELLAKDGIVFWNDLGGAAAGVFRFDGVRWTVGKALTKFGSGGNGSVPVLQPAGKGAKPGAGTGKQPATPRDRDRRPDRPGDQDRPDSRQPDPTDGPPAPDQQRPQDPANPDPGNPDPGNPDPGNPGPTSPGSTDPGASDPPPPRPPVISGITASPTTPVREQVTTFSADVANATGATWSWRLTAVADGRELATAATPNGFDATIPAGVTDVRVDLTVTVTGVGEDSGTQTFSTTNSRAPQVDSVTADPDAPSVGQLVRFTGSENVVKGDGTWAWSVRNVATNDVQGPFPGAFGDDFLRSFQAGQFEVTLSVTFDGVESHASTQVTVADRCQLVRGGTDTVDLLDAASGSIGAGLQSCFGPPPDVTVTTASFLSAGAPQVTAPNPDTGAGGSASVTVSRAADPPMGPERVADAITFRLPNGSNVRYDVLINHRPVISSATCNAVPGTPALVNFSVTFTDDQTNQARSTGVSTARSTRSPSSSTSTCRRTRPAGCTSTWARRTASTSTSSSSPSARTCSTATPPGSTGSA